MSQRILLLRTYLTVLTVGLSGLGSHGMYASPNIQYEKVVAKEPSELAYQYTYDVSIDVEPSISTKLSGAWKQPRWKDSAALAWRLLSSRRAEPVREKIWSAPRIQKLDHHGNVAWDKSIYEIDEDALSQLSTPLQTAIRSEGIRKSDDGLLRYKAFRS